MYSTHWNYDVKENNYTSSSSFPSKITLQITSIIHTAIQKKRKKRAKKFAFNQALGGQKFQVMGPLEDLSGLQGFKISRDVRKLARTSVHKKENKIK